MVPCFVPEIEEVESVEYSGGEYLRKLQFEHLIHFSYTFHTFAPEAYCMQTALLCDAEEDAQSIKLRCRAKALQLLIRNRAASTAPADLCQRFIRTSSSPVLAGCNRMMKDFPRIGHRRRNRLQDVILLLNEGEKGIRSSPFTFKV